MPSGFVVAVGTDHEGMQLVSAHDSIEEALATLPSQKYVSGPPSGSYDWYEITDVSTMKKVKSLSWHCDRSGAPVFWELREDVNA